MRSCTLFLAVGVLALLAAPAFASITNTTTSTLLFYGDDYESAPEVSHSGWLGELRAEVLDKEGNVIRPFSLANCSPVTTDRTLQRITWKGAADLSELAGKPVRFRFTLKNGALYSFWVSPERSGASHGYVAAGGPGFTGPTDTIGEASNKAVK